MRLVRLTLHLFILTCFPLILGTAAKAQLNPLETEGVVPWGSYQHGAIDSVNLMNGAVTFHIPLFSLPQKGRLALSFSITGSTNTFHSSKVCSYSDGPPCWFVGARTGQGGYLDPAPWPYVSDLGPKLDQYLSWGGNYIDNKNTLNRALMFYTVQEVTGASHTLGYDNANLALLRATDGSGFLYTTDAPDPYYVNTSPHHETIYTPGGLQYLWNLTNGSGLTSVNMTIQDPDSNSISIQSSQVTDSIGRSFPLLPTSPTSSTSGCPTVSANYQPTTSSSTWTVPGPNGLQQTYLFCYASVYYHTSFFGGCVSSCGTYNHDSAGTLSLLQSVVLPNGSYWTFTYDAANPADNTSIGYAQVVRVRLPTGGTISYQYGTINTQCESTVPNYNRSLSTRTFDPGNGSLSTWTYNGGTVTDPLGNDTVTTFITLSGCDAYETKQQSYQGSSSTGTLLRTKATAYQYVNGNSNPQAIFTYNTSAGVFPTTVTTTLDSGQVTTTTFQYNDGGFSDVQPWCVYTSCTTSGLPSAQIPFGRPTSTTTTDYTGATLKTVQTQYLYQQNSAYYPGNFLDQIASATTLSGSGTQVAKTTYGYDENNGSPQGIFGHQTSVNRWLNTTGGNLTSKRVYNTQGMVTQSVDPLLNATIFTYDSTGAFLSQIQYPTTGGVSHIEHFSIDPNTGLATSHTDQNGQITSTQYDVMRRVTLISYPDGGQTTNCYTDIGGSTCTQTAPPYAVVTTRKINSAQNETTTDLVDGLGRLSQTQLNSDPDGVTYVDTTYDGLGRVYCVSNPYRSTGDATYGITTRVYDALGRATQLQPSDYWSNNSATSPTCQNVTPSTVPANPSNKISTSYSGNTTTVTDQAGKSRESVADGLGRLTQVFEDPGLSPHSNFETDYGYDALDNLLTVNQKGGSTNSTQWRPRSFTYDSLSRLTSTTNPESNTVPSTGGTLATTYSYDANGNLLSKTSPAPNQTGTATVTVSYCYDALNRMTAKAYTFSPNTPPTCSGTPPFPSPAATFAYDLSSVDGATLSKPVGRLVKSQQISNWNLPANTYFSYDPMGRVQSQGQCARVNCGTYGSSPNWWLVTNTFDLAGDLASFTDAYGDVFTQTFDGAARPWKLTGNWVDSNHPQNLYTVGTASQPNYTPFGAVGTALFGNGLTAAYAYNNRLQPCRIDWNTTAQSLANCTASTPSTSILDFTYGFNAGSNNGNVASWSATGQQTFARSFSYDNLNRISQMQETGGNGEGCKPASSPTSPYTLSWTIDAWGNRTSQNASAGTCTASYSADSNNRSVGGSFDSAGNLLCDGAHCYFYDAENRIYQVDGNQGDCSTATACYQYNAEGQRVAKYTNPGGVLTYFVYGSDGEVVAEADTNLNWIQTYIHFGGQLVAQYRGSGTGFIHKDHLGSTRLVTAYPWVNATQSVSESMDYLPYGDELLVSGTTTTSHSFTSKEHDSESGLDNFGARYDSSRWGRFMSPDWSASPSPVPYASFSNPQSLNLYAYVKNNPLNLRDLDGHDPFGDFFKRLKKFLHFWRNWPYRGDDPYYTTPIQYTSQQSRQIRAIQEGMFFGAIAATGAALDASSGGGDEESNMGSAAADATPAEVESEEAVVGEFSEYTDVTKSSSIKNIKTNVTPEEFGKTLETNGFTKSGASGGATAYTKGNTQYTIYAQAKSTQGPTAQVKVNGNVVAKIRLQK